MYFGRNFRTRARLTCTVPSSLGSARMSIAADAKYVSFSNPRAAMTSQSRLMTRSPSLVTFIFVIGLYSRNRRSSGEAARK